MVASSPSMRREPEIGFTVAKRRMISTVPTGTFGRPERAKSPAASDQVPMPRQQGLGLDEEPSEALAGTQASDPGQHRPVGRPQHGAEDLAKKDSHLVAQHDDLRGHVVVVTPGEPE